MLRRTRIFVIIFFLFSVSVWGGYKIYARSHADTSSPVITMDETSVTVSVEDGDKGILEGVRAEDKKDGDLTDQIFIESRSNFIEKGRFTVTFAVADSDNHVSKASREITYSDYHSPRFELSQPLKFQTTSETMDDLNIAANLSASTATAHTEWNLTPTGIPEKEIPRILTWPSSKTVSAIIWSKK